MLDSPLASQVNIKISNKIDFFESAYAYCLREDTHKKSVFLVVGPLRFYPPYTNGLVVHAIFFSGPCHLVL